MLCGRGVIKHKCLVLFNNLYFLVSYAFKDVPNDTSFVLITYSPNIWPQNNVPFINTTASGQL